MLDLFASYDFKESILQIHQIFHQNLILLVFFNLNKTLIDTKFGFFALLIQK